MAPSNRSFPLSLPSLALLLLILAAAPAAAQDDVISALVWEPKTSFPGGGRHHPITFANATHGFLLTGTSLSSSYTSDFWIYDAANDVWTDLSNTAAAFPGVARSFGYGAASTTNCSNPNAYLGFGASATDRLTDFWEFDMSYLTWRRLAEFPGPGRRHPAMNYIEGSVNEIHVGLGDGTGGNYNDWWAYSIDTDAWRQLPNLPGVPRHHPFYFTIGLESYAGLGHSQDAIERDWYRWDSVNGAWIVEDEFASYSLSETPSLVTTEARVAGTEFSTSGSCDDTAKTYGFVLSGDGDDHGTIATGEFHMFDPYDEDGNVGMGVWHPLPPHPGFSRWAPGSFVLQGSSQVYFIGGYDRTLGVLYDDLWMMDLAPLFEAMAASNSINTTATPESTLVPTSNSSDLETTPPTSSASSTRKLDVYSGALGYSASFLVGTATVFMSALLV